MFRQILLLNKTLQRSFENFEKIFLNGLQIFFKNFFSNKMIEKASMVFIKFNINRIFIKSIIQKIFSIFIYGTMKSSFYLKGPFVSNATFLQKSLINFFNYPPMFLSHRALSINLSRDFRLKVLHSTSTFVVST